MFNKTLEIRKYLRQEMFPSIFCVGCGCGSVLNHTLRAVHDLQLDIDKIVFVSGIGCSSRLPGYIDADGLHTTHGRALAFAQGVKLANPELTVIVFTGDGDCSGIGGNHLIHAARRNVDLTVIEMNNYNYGMTGGQASPTTPTGGLATTSPYGALEQPFDLCNLVLGAGAPYVARYPMGLPYETIAAIKDAISRPGFSFIEVLTPCPTGFTLKNKIRENKQLWDWYKDHTILQSKYLAMSEADRADCHKLVTGVLRDRPRPEFTARYKELVARMAD